MEALRLSPEGRSNGGPGAEAHGISERIPDPAPRGEAPTLPAPMPSLDPVEAKQTDTLGRRELLCTACGYRAVAKATPAQCPMCAGTAWDFVDWRPFSSR